MNSLESVLAEFKDERASYIVVAMATEIIRLRDIIGREAAGCPDGWSLPLPALPKEETREETEETEESAEVAP